MPIPFERIVKEDFNIGHGTVAVTNPAGGAALTGTKVGLHTWTGEYSVVDFGATGDGVTNDYAAIVDTITHAQVAGANVVFPAGVYERLPDA